MLIKFVAKLIACLVLACGLSVLCAAQQTPPPASSDPTTLPSQPQDDKSSASPQQTPQPSSSSSPQSSPSQSQSPQPKPSDNSQDKSKSAGDNNGGKVEGTSNDRLFYTLPNFLTLEKAGQLPPLSVKDKFKVVALGDFDPVQYPWWGLLAAINQANDSEPAYGQGWLGYAKRYGTTAADSTLENFMVGAILPSALHQDPRYYELGHGSFFHRTGYAISRIFVTHGDSGSKQFNFSEILGSAASAAISTYGYHPRATYLSTPTNPHKFIASDRTLANTASVWYTQVSLDTMTLVIKEFWPDVHRKLSHKKNNAVSASGDKP